MSKPIKRGRPITGRARPHRMMVCFNDAELSRLADALVVRAHNHPAQAALPEGRRIAAAYLVAKLAALAMGRDEMIDRVAADHAAALVVA